MKVLGAKYLDIPIHRHPQGGWILYQTVFGFYLPGRFLTISELMLAMDNARKAASRLSQTRLLPSGAGTPEGGTEKGLQVVVVDRHNAALYPFLSKLMLDFAIGSAIVWFVAFIYAVSKGWTP